MREEWIHEHARISVNGHFNAHDALMEHRKDWCEKLVMRGLPIAAAPKALRHCDDQGGQMENGIIRLNSRSVLETNICRNCHEHVEQQERMHATERQ